MTMLPALLVGAAAARALAGLGDGGSVLAVFSRSLYVAGPAGIACIGGEGLGAGPLNLVCRLPEGWSFENVAAGAPVVTSGGRLSLGDGTQVDWAGAGLWRAPAPPEARRLRQGLDALATAASALGRSDGLAPLLTGDMPDTAASPLLRLALPAVAALRCFLAGAAPEPAIGDLLGLGPGLTPSGDDLLGGALVALAVVDPDRRRALAGFLEPRLDAATSRISAAHLRAAMAGEGGEALHMLVSAVLAGEAAAVMEALTRLAAIGHSSGLDMAAGATLALRAAR